MVGTIQIYDSIVETHLICCHGNQLIPIPCVIAGVVGEDASRVQSKTIETHFTGPTLSGVMSPFFCRDVTLLQHNASKFRGSQLLGKVAAKQVTPTTGCVCCFALNPHKKLKQVTLNQQKQVSLTKQRNPGAEYLDFTQRKQCASRGATAKILASRI